MPLRILFVSTANACRSQMAEGWARHLAPDGVVARSGGTAPRHVHPLAIRVMQEAGVDIGGHRGKSVAPLLERERFDVVVTVCETARAELGPPRHGARTFHRAFDDPSFLTADDDLDIESFRALRDEIRAFVEEILAAG